MDYIALHKHEQGEGFLTQRRRDAETTQRRIFVFC